MRMNKQNKTCADCIHERACRIWTDVQSLCASNVPICPSYATMCYDFSLRDEFPIVAENNISIKSVIEQAILDAVLGLTHPTEKGGEG